MKYVDCKFHNFRHTTHMPLVVTQVSLAHDTRAIGL